MSYLSPILKPTEATDPAKLSLRTGKSTDRVELYDAISGADHEHIPVRWPPCAQAVLWGLWKLFHSAVFPASSWFTFLHSQYFKPPKWWSFIQKLHIKFLNEMTDLCRSRSLALRRASGSSQYKHPCHVLLTESQTLAPAGHCCPLWSVCTTASEPQGRSCSPSYSPLRGALWLFCFFLMEYTCLS